jgi:hypothetical protein
MSWSLVREGGIVKTGVVIATGWRVVLGTACCTLTLIGKHSVAWMMNPKVILFKVTQQL